MPHHNPTTRTMHTLYFAFYNNPANPLDELSREDREINDILRPLMAKQHFSTQRDSFASLNDIANGLTAFSKDLLLFHFGGHAGHEQILLEGEEAKTRGMAAFLGQCPRLQLVFLNGCATAGQVDLLLEQKVPAIIASYRPVEDSKARRFAVHFYRTLSEGKTLEEAFMAASAKVNAIDDTLEIAREAGRPSGKANSTPLWGLFVLPGREEIRNWRLPMGADHSPPTDYVPNKSIIDALLEALAPYRSGIQKILQDEEMGIERSKLDKREEILVALPHPVSDQLRWLFTTPDKQEQAEKFFHQPGPNRLRQIVRLFDIIIELMAFIMLAQLWDALGENEELEIPEMTKQQIQDFLSLSNEKRDKLALFALIRSIRLVFDKNHIPYFVEELSDLHPQFLEGTPFYEAARFLDANRDSWKKVDQRTAINLAIEAEERLASIFSRLGFMGRYTFASVKTIDVLKYRHQKKPNFKHTLVKLVLRLGELGEEPRLLQKFLDTSSVLVIKNYDKDKDGLEFLNLTPFILDENAFDENAKIAKLHFLQNYCPNEDRYVFRHIYEIDDIPLLITDQLPFRVIKAQFDAFSQLLFHKKMREAVL
jgi:hypothetical protein